MGFFALDALRNLFAILTLEHYSWTTALFPAALGVACLLLAAFLMARRAAVRNHAAIADSKEA